MEFKKLMTAVALMGALMAGSGIANAKAEAQAAFNARYLTDDTACTTCHASNNVANTVGAAWLAAGGSKTTAPSSWTTFETQAGSTFGGVDPAWTEPAAASSSSSGGCVTGSVATPLTMVLAMLALGFFVRRKKD